jgi:CHAD domain-containing protein
LFRSEFLRKASGSVAHKALPTIVPTPKIGLDVWMEKVLDLSEKAREDFDIDTVHDLRVAMRRCRTMADTLSEVNPDPGWRKMKKASRPLFQSLGRLRDCQIERDWVKKIGGSGDAYRRHLLKQLGEKEKRLKLESAVAVGKFDRKEWRKWTKRLSDKAQFFPLESVVFQRLAQGRINEAVELFDRARKGRSRVAWHRLRIGLKRFRYTVENFLPERYGAWQSELKSLQDLLGEVHDLDVLRAESRRHNLGWDPAVLALWLEKIESARKTRLDQVLLRLGGGNSPIIAWRAGLQNGRALQPAPAVRATERSAYSAS